MRTWMKEWRILNNLTQQQMAERIDIPETTIASYEQGHRTPSVMRAKEMSRRMNTLDKNGRVKWTYFFDDKVHITSTPEEVS
ncbi:helix-turn-helix transcriptional regulator [Levilactobacillus tujiorum]|uniref:helix-turn-helix transcriptional regulator n=1 Tax=Levilactobacillus tujiorum TaxID=2912243 RepID=UPI001457693E|nr:helix-turn-helix transcriptional regulator [Levilactobacillus tujiorum]NLR32243.1 helix-turn-helix transcriptional regulator [Levilactobacillus tujiorum]